MSNWLIILLSAIGGAVLLLTLFFLFIAWIAKPHSEFMEEQRKMIYL